MFTRVEAAAILILHVNLRTRIDHYVARQSRLPEGVFGRVIMNRIFSAVNRHRIEQTLRQLSLSENLSVLDIGCGNGDLLFRLLHNYPSCVSFGIDLSDAMTTIVKRKNADSGPGGGIKLAAANWNQLPFIDRSFDRIVASNVIYFWKNPQKILSELRRVLKSNGRVTIILQPVSSGAQSSFVDYGYDTYSQDGAISLLEQNGFQIIDVSSKGEKSKDRSWKVLWITASLT